MEEDHALRTRSRGSNREEADMAISDVEQVTFFIYLTNSADFAVFKGLLNEFIKLMHHTPLIN